MSADASKVMMVKRAAVTSALAAGLAMVAGGLAGVGTAAGAAGSGSHYTLSYAPSYYGSLDSHSLVHWARCTTINGVRKTNVIDYRVNPAGHASRVRLVKHGIRKVHRATGLRFHYLGRTSYIPRKGVSALTGQLTFFAKEQRRKTGADLVVAWAAKGSGSAASNLLTDFEDGVGTIKWASGPTSQLRILEAAVVIDKGKKLRSGFRAGGSAGTLLLHELGHAMGLQHYADGTQIMNPYLGPQSPSGYAAGDRTGLAKVGSGTACLTTKALPPSND